MSEYTKLANILHTLYCKKEHEDVMEAMLKHRVASKCYYYLEETFANSEEQLDHVRWEKEASNLCAKLEAQPSDAIRIIVSLIDIRRRIDSLLAKYPTAEEIVPDFLDALDTVSAEDAQL